MGFNRPAACKSRTDHNGGTWNQTRPKQALKTIKALYFDWGCDSEVVAVTRFPEEKVRIAARLVEFSGDAHD